MAIAMSSSRADSAVPGVSFICYMRVIEFDVIDHNHVHLWQRVENFTILPNISSETCV